MTRLANCAYLDQPEDAAEPEDSDDPEQRRGNGKLIEDILHDKADYRGGDECQIEQIPRQGEIMVSKSNHFNNGLCAFVKQTRL